MRLSTDTDVQKLWSSYRKSRSQELRNQLVEHYLDLVRAQAHKIHSRLPPGADLDEEDLIVAGSLGLMQAVEAFDSQRGTGFGTFAFQRIRGAIQDALREIDWAPRLVRSRQRSLGRARRQLRDSLGREPESGELAQHLDVPESILERIEADARPVGMASLSAQRYETDAGKEVCQGDLLASRRGPSPFEACSRRDLVSALIRGLSRQEKLVILLYYLDGLTMREVGQVVGWHESRVSQVHAQLLLRIKAAWHGRGDFVSIN